MVLAIRSRSFPSLTAPLHFAQVGEHVLLAIVLLGWGLSALTKRQLGKGLDRIEERLNEALTITAEATNAAAKLSVLSKNLTEAAQKAAKGQPEPSPFDLETGLSKPR